MNRSLFYAGMVVVLTWQAQGAERTWSNTAGGAFETGSNWVGGNVPGASDNANFTSNANYAVTFASPVTNANAFFYAPGGTVSLDIGLNNLYYVATLMRVENVGGAASVDLTSGAMLVNKIYVGDKTTNNGNHLTVRNPGSSLSTRTDDILVGVNGSDNALLVTNGATVAAYRLVYAGYEPGGSNNAIVVSGGDSRLVAYTTGIMIGRRGDSNRLVLEEGAEVTCTNGSLVVGEQAGSDYNSVFVRSGCVLTNGGSSGVSFVGKAGAYNSMTVSNAAFRNYANLNVGDSGSFNRLEVLDGATALLRTHLYIGTTASSVSNTVVVAGSNSLLRTMVYDINVGNNGHYNTLLVTNGAVAQAYRSIYVGTTGGSSYNQLIVSGTNSVLKGEGTGATFSLAVGKVGTNNTFRLEDGAQFVCTNTPEFSIGVDVGTLGNSVFIGSGCLATNPGNVYMGKSGNVNSFTLSNATFFAGGYTHVGYSGSGNSMTLCEGSKYYYAGHCHVGYYAGANSNTLLVTGGGTILTNQNFDLDVGFSGSGNRMRIADGAAVTIQRSIFVGHNIGASNNVLEIEGGTLRSLQAASGTPTMIVSNACTLAVYGSNSVIQAKALKIVGGSRLDVRVGRDGFTPITATGAVTFDATTKLKVDATAFAKAGGGTLALMTYGSKVGAILAENMTLLPEGTTVNQADGNRITLRVPSFRGTMISVQ